MRKGIVAGEPGMFPWPFGRLYGVLGRWLRGQHRPAQERSPSPEPADGQPGPPGPGYGPGRTDQTRLPERDGD